MSLFDNRIPFKPFEYPEYYTEGWLKQAQAFWLHTEIPMQGDVKDWNENSSQREKGVYVKKTDPNHDGKNLVLRQMMSKLEEVKIEISLTKSLPTTPLVKSFFKFFS